MPVMLVSLSVKGLRLMAKHIRRVVNRTGCARSMRALPSFCASGSVRVENIRAHVVTPCECATDDSFALVSPPSTVRKITRLDLVEGGWLR